MAIRIKVSELLGKYKMSQKELAEKTGIRPATISALFHEQIKRIDVDHINSLCRVFNCTPCEIFDYIPDEGESFSNNNTINKVDNVSSNPPFHYAADQNKHKSNKGDMELVNTDQGIVIREKNEGKGNTYNITRKYIEEILFDIMNDNNKKNN